MYSMKRKYLFLSIILLATIAFVNQSCEGMDDNFRQYLGERNYSGRVDSLTATPGVNRVVLRWVNPTDQRSRSIRIVYGPDNNVLEFPTLVNEASIEGLTDATGREFTVFTVDAFGNLSVPVSTTAIPVSETFIGNLTPPTPVVMAVGLDQSITFIGSSNVLMRFAGHIRYTITAPDGTIFQGEADLSDQEGAVQANMIVSEHLVGVDILSPGAYSFEYEVAVLPVMGGVITEDVVWLRAEREVQVQPVRFNLTRSPGTPSASHVGNLQFNEGINRLFDGTTGKFLVTSATLNNYTPVMNGISGRVWMQWAMERPFAITEYAITMANDAAGRDPRSWIIFASNDRTTWTEITRQTDWMVGQNRPRHSRWVFQVPATAAYSYWRMFVTANHGDGIFQMQEFELFFDTTPSP